MLIGITAQSFQDYHHTPFSNQYTRWFPGRSSRMAGTELQANVLATIADGAYIRSPLHPFRPSWPPARPWGCC